MSSEPTAILRDGAVRFPTLEDFRSELADYLSKGALRAMGDSLPQPLTEFDFALHIPEGETVPLRGMIVATTPECVLIQLSDFDRRVAMRLSAASAKAPAPTPAPTPAPAPAPRAVDLHALSGEIRNPTELGDLAALPTANISAAEDLSSTSTIALIRFLAAHKVTGTLTLEGETSMTLPITGGVYQLSKRDRDHLHEPAFAPEGWFRFVAERPKVGLAQKPVSAWGLVAHSLRIWLRRVEVEELRCFLSLDSAVTLHPGFAGLARTLGLSSTERRLAEREFKGESPLSKIIGRNAMTDRSLLQLVYALHALGLAEFVESHDIEVARSPIETMQEECDRLEKADHFAALGVHWSAHQKTIDARIEELRAEFGPGSEAHEISPTLAAARLALAERAYRRLSTVAERRAYRDSQGVNVEAAAKLLVDQARLMKGRGEIREALEHLYSAMELKPIAEAVALLRTLQAD